MEILHAMKQLIFSILFLLVLLSANSQDIDNVGSTANNQVSIMSEDFYIPQLDRSRKIWIYLPPDYSTSSKSYPVLYMHDGQNLFDVKTSFIGEWHVDETLDSLFAEGYSVPIVIGIDNGGNDRINEYTVWKHSEYGGGEGGKYAAFLVETLKPFVDSAYRTLPDRKNTAIMGSSLGALISFYTALKYQDVFSKIGLFSPSYWYSDSTFVFAENHPLEQEMRIYQMMGSLEGEEYIEDAKNMHKIFKTNSLGDVDLHVRVVPFGAHNEKLWSKDFGSAVKYLFED